ncbi:hypothetical protein DPEC_G00126070 [Dallia pectoralis]|uniref:Uncharacterized protein n=2 Tax=Dallia pectoralis TaxID=75939 RepID=A0ACC2GR84_DALPE|nr:hypothetical protein DPEC_G00126060 [Dallia pectoralis]KAJ8006224.1 hypothetical protein DPEC_G00126070 [Dallia pectoralis]
MAQQTVSKRIKRTPDGINRTGVQLAGGYLFQPPSPPIISAVRKWPVCHRDRRQWRVGLWHRSREQEDIGSAAGGMQLTLWH